MWHRNKELTELPRVIDYMGVVTGSLEGELLGKLLAVWVKKGNNVGWKGPEAVSALSPCSSQGHSEVTLEFFQTAQGLFRSIAKYLRGRSLYRLSRAHALEMSELSECLPAPELGKLPYPSLYTSSSSQSDAALWNHRLWWDHRALMVFCISKKKILSENHPSQSEFIPRPCIPQRQCICCPALVFPNTYSEIWLELKNAIIYVCQINSCYLLLSFQRTLL